VMDVDQSLFLDKARIAFLGREKLVIEASTEPPTMRAPLQKYLVATEQVVGNFHWFHLNTSILV